MVHCVMCSSSSVSVTGREIQGSQSSESLVTAHPRYVPVPATVA